MVDLETWVKFEENNLTIILIDIFNITLIFNEDVCLGIFYLIDLVVLGYFNSSI